MSKGLMKARCREIGARGKEELQINSGQRPPTKKGLKKTNPQRPDKEFANFMPNVKPGSF